MATILITGGTGLIGSALTQMLLTEQYEVIILSRQKNKTSTQANLSYAYWDIGKQLISTEAIAKADYIIHLAGAGVADQRWSVKRKQEISDSRTQSGRLIVRALQNVPNKVQAIISSSGIGWYGPDTPTVIQNGGFTENATHYPDFLGNTCHLWEQSLEPATQLNKRVVYLRTGIVLSTNGGALPQFINPIKKGIAAILGNGKQVISWIHITDLCRLFIHAIHNNNMQGPYNAVSPHPCTNKQLTVMAAQIIKGKFYIPIHVPQWVIKLMIGEMSVEVLKSTTVSAQKIKQSGFSFVYPHLNAALQQLLVK